MRRKPRTIYRKDWLDAESLAAVEAIKRTVKPYRLAEAYWVPFPFIPDEPDGDKP